MKKCMAFHTAPINMLGAYLMIVADLYYTVFNWFKFFDYARLCFFARILNFKSPFCFVQL